MKIHGYNGMRVTITSWLDLGLAPTNENPKPYSKPCQEPMIGEFPGSRGESAIINQLNGYGLKNAL